jgi:drug/metabolite transporter (DMT)-like permease
MFLTATRALRGTPDSALVGLQMAGALVMGVLLAPFSWVTPSAGVAALLLLIGMVSTAGHVLVVRALRLAPASVVVPFKYVSLVLASFYGWTIFGDVPRPAMLAGAGVIISAGLWLWWLERRQERA